MRNREVLRSCRRCRLMADADSGLRRMRQTRDSRAATVSEFLLSGPKFDDFEIERDKDTGREIVLE